LPFKYYWEDFEVGQKVRIGSKVAKREEMIEFASKYDPQPFHVDEAAAARSMYGGLIASGWHTGAMVMRLMCENYLLQSASLGSPGIDHLKWLKPVRPDDRLEVYRTTLESRASRSKPEMGVVKFLWEVMNQNGELVMTMEGYGMFLRRDPQQ
jgi:acyl dehydratase